MQSRWVFAATPLPGRELQADQVGGMAVECPDPGTEGPQDRSLGSGGHYGALGSGPCPPPTAPTPWSLPRWRAYVAAAVLCYANLLNYMNWFIVAGEEGDRHPGQPLLLHPLAALTPASTAYPQWPSAEQAFVLWSISLLSSLLAVTECGEGHGPSPTPM